MKITLIRHGAVEEAYKNCYNGHNDISLSPEGREEAKKLAKKFEGKNFDTIFCSDLRRAKETLFYLQRDESVKYTKLLREKSWGRHEGMSFSEIEAEGIAYENFSEWIKALDGEDIKLYIRRIELFFLSYLPLTKRENILVVTHAGVIRTLWHLSEGISLEEAFSRPLPYGSFTQMELL